MKIQYPVMTKKYAQCKHLWLRQLFELFHLSEIKLPWKPTPHLQHPQKIIARTAEMTWCTVLLIKSWTILSRVMKTFSALSPTLNKVNRWLLIYCSLTIERLCVLGQLDKILRWEDRNIGWPSFNWVIIILNVFHYYNFSVS